MNLVGKYRNSKRLSLVVGLLLALLIVTTQSSVYFFSENIAISYSLEQDEEKQQEAPQYFSNNAVAVSSVQLNLDKPFQVVFELLLPNDEQPTAKPETVPLCLNFFKNLFRLTISPNAP